jgi:hypothetical protein
MSLLPMTRSVGVRFPYSTFTGPSRVGDGATYGEYG